MARPRGDEKRQRTVRLPTRFDDRFEKARAAYEKKLRKAAGPAIRPPSIEDWLAYLAMREIGE